MTAAIIFLLMAVMHDPPADISSLVRAGDASYLKADYENARQSFQKAWELAQETPPDNPARYDILKRLTSARAAAWRAASNSRVRSRR